jgi:hypothetical protein
MRMVFDGEFVLAFDGSAVDDLRLVTARATRLSVVVIGAPETRVLRRPCRHDEIFLEVVSGAKEPSV